MSPGKKIVTSCAFLHCTFFFSSGFQWKIQNCAVENRYILNFTIPLLNINFSLIYFCLIRICTIVQPVLNSKPIASEIALG